MEILVHFYKSLRQMLILMLRKKSCISCGEFAPAKMMENGVCLFCVYHQEKLYDDVGWERGIKIREK